MKFVAKHGAPDLPLPLLEAQESGRLALFCGAGVSYPAGLPDFKGLVEAIYGKLGSPPEPLEKIAIRQRLYDRALELIERRHHKGPGKPNPMRLLLNDILEIKAGANLTTHQSLLLIATAPTGQRRLVTTNFDHGFRAVDATTIDQTHAAPRLPVPKPHKWRSIVYLHGILDSRNDPGNDTLVLTSGDFGAAYLTERWASRFVTELFAFYTVLFVGYSIDDPVIRYMTDAIAADRRLGMDGVQQPYVLARTTPSRCHEDEKAWMAKGVQPILYHSDRKHSHLHRTLEKWAAYCKDGLNAKERIIRTRAIIAPRPPYDNDETVSQVIDILREKVDLTDSVTGYSARIFASLEDPPAPVEWLPVLELNGLLERSVVPALVKPVHSAHHEGLHSKPNPISANLWTWLCHHLESRELVNWVIDRGCCLHPDFAFEVKRRLNGPLRPSDPYDRFWNALVLGLVQCGGEEFDRGFLDIKSEVALGDPVALRAFLDMLTPRVAFEKSFDWEAIYRELGDDAPEYAPFSMKVEVRLSDWEFEELRQLVSYPSFLGELLPELSGRLSDALALLSAFDKADAESDRSYWDMPSIEPHPQNNRFNNWTFLIELCRDAWVHAWDVGSPVASAIFSLWRSGQFPTLRRLALHAATQRPVLEPDLALILLFDDDHWWLWSIEVNREKYRLLSAIWPALSPDAAQRLEEAILQGPPRRMYKEGLSDEQWRDTKEHQVWQHLAKLVSFGRHLSTSAADELQRLTAAHPEWKLRGDDRDEFISWFESGTGNQSDVSVGHLIKMPVADRMALLKEEDRNFHDGRIDVFRHYSQEHPDLAVESLVHMADQNDWDRDVWHAALMGVASSNSPQQLQIFELVSRADEKLLNEESWVIAYWLRKAASTISPDSEIEALYWNIFDILYREALKRENDLGDDPVNKAINHPVGILVESFLDRIASRRLTRETGLSDQNIRGRLEHILLQRNNPGILGLTILFSRLHFFHAVAPDWCRTEMLPALDWTDPGLARPCWLGYLWMPRVSVELATDLAQALIATLAHGEELGSHADRAVELFAIICLEFPDVISSRDASEGLARASTNGYAAISKLIWRSLRVEEDQADDAAQQPKPKRTSSDSYWVGRVAPFINNSWSRDVTYRSETRSQNLVLAVLQLDSAFPDAVNLIQPFLGTIQNPGFVIRTALKKERLVRKYPREAFALLDELFGANWRYPDQSLRQLLNIIGEQLPELRDTNARYREMEQFLVARNL